jgi:hypothetical protein
MLMLLRWWRGLFGGCVAGRGRGSSRPGITHHRSDEGRTDGRESKALTQWHVHVARDAAVSKQSCHEHDASAVGTSALTTALTTASCRGCTPPQRTTPPRHRPRRNKAADTPADCLPLPALQTRSSPMRTWRCLSMARTRHPANGASAVMSVCRLSSRHGRSSLGSLTQRNHRVSTSRRHVVSGSLGGTQNCSTSRATAAGLLRQQANKRRTHTACCQQLRCRASSRDAYPDGGGDQSHMQTNGAHQHI